MPRYALLRHDCPADYRDGPHWDLMLESAGVLLTWSLLELPIAWADAGGELPIAQTSTVEATKLPDHRLVYLDYEGEVSRGRGSVVRAAAGEYGFAEAAEHRLSVRASSGELAGEWRLAQESGDAWRLSVSSNGVSSNRPAF